MISLGSKFADYGLTAGFMICTQFALLFWVAPNTLHSILVASAMATRSYLELLPNSLAAAASAVLATFAIISIFFVGLLLELIGSVAIIWEVRVFKQQLERNHQWLATFLEPYGQGAKEDFDRLMSEFGDVGKEEWLEIGRMLRFWKRSAWAIMFNQSEQVFRRFKLLRPFSRLQSLLLSYILAADSPPRLDFLRDHLHLCGISRAISACLYILALELVVFGNVQLHSHGLSISYFAASLLGLLMCFLAIFLPVKAYARFCDSLFSLALVLYRRMNREVSLEEDRDTEKA
jgi:hypothetical protein